MTSSTHASISPSLTSPSAPSRPARMGGLVQQYCWTYQGKAATIAYETLGTADRPTVLLLPAFSTVSTRAELSKIAQVLAPHFQVIAMDWLGFGDSDRPAYAYNRPLYQQLLTDFVQACCPQPAAILAAGHAAGYALHLVRSQKDNARTNAKLLLVAPTWKGPFRAMGAPGWVATGVRNLVRSPLLGQTLYGLNTHPAFLKWMYQRHVYADSTQLTSAFMAERHRITQHSGARFAPGAFVTGGLDPMADRSEWVEVATDVVASSSGESVANTAVHIIVPEKAPPKSSAEMAALSAVLHVQTYGLPGSLGVYEEYGAEVGAIALDYFQSTI